MEHVAAICFACRSGQNGSRAARYVNLFFKILPEALFNEILSFVQTLANHMPGHNSTATVLMSSAGYEVMFSETTHTAF